MVERVWGKEEAEDDQYEGVCGPGQHREVCRESSEQRGLFQGWCCAVAGSLPVLLLWDSRRERWDAPGSDSRVGRAASILSSLCP